ncbi:SUKH-4 family immunity protein [Streptomyces sp. JNUCC 64]
MDDTALAALLAGRAPHPYPGVWQEPPFAEREADGARYALVALDPGLSALGVRRSDGSVWGLPDDGEPFRLNSGAAAFVAFTRAYGEAAAEAEAYEAPDSDPDGDEAERAADALTEALLERFAAIDAEAVADENAFWCVVAEELGYGMAG